MDWSKITGWLGVLVVLFAFYLTVVRDWDPKSGRYMMLSNAVAVLMMVNAWIN